MAVMLWVAYHGRSGDEHQAQYNILSGQGYRIHSLSVYGDPDSPVYAAVWYQQSGPDWIAAHGLDAEGYQAFVTNGEKQGFRPTLVTAVASGWGDDAVFAAVLEKDSVPWWQAEHGVMVKKFNDDDSQLHNIVEKVGTDEFRIRLRSVAIYVEDSTYIVEPYGLAAAAAVWERYKVAPAKHVNGVTVGEDWFHRIIAHGDWQAQFDDLSQGNVLKLVVPSFSGEYYSSLWHTRAFEPISNWFAKIGMSADEYQQMFDSLTSEGFRPDQFRGANDDDGNIGAIFVK
jgi:hypothetical protein